VRDNLKQELFENLWEFCKFIEDADPNKARSDISMEMLRANEVKSSIISILKYASELEKKLERLELREMGKYLEDMEEIDNEVDFDHVGDFPEVQRLRDKLRLKQELVEILKKGAKEELDQHKAETKALNEEIERLRDSLGSFRPLFTGDDESSVTL